MTSIDFDDMDDQDYARVQDHHDRAAAVFAPLALSVLLMWDLIDRASALRAHALADDSLTPERALRLSQLMGLYLDRASALAAGHGPVTEASAGLRRVQIHMKWFIRETRAALL